MIGRFDKDGVFETFDPYYINKFKAARVPIVKEPEVAVIQQPPIEPEAFVCKLCNMPFATQGERLAHYKSAEHKAKKAEQENK
jgi:hypothetical protein